jgi:protein-disulfide isomerase
VEGAAPRRGRLAVALALGFAAAALLAGIYILSVSKGRATIPIHGADAVQRIYGGLPQDGARLGDEGAPITVELFDDLQCSSCAPYYLSTTPRLVEDLVRSGRAQLAFRHFSLSERESEVSAYAATAAGEQGRQWQYIHLFFANQGEARRTGVTNRFMKAVAENVPDLDLKAWDRDRDDPAVARIVKADGDLSTQLRLPAAPAAVVDGPTGTRKLIESPSVAAIERAVDEVG